MSHSKILVIGGSAGSIRVIRQLLGQIDNARYPVVIVIHLPSGLENQLQETLAACSSHPVHSINDKMKLEAGHIYIAPGGYHTYIESNKLLSLSLDEKEHFCRPSIDVLFSSAADVYQHNCLAVLLSGANNDGTEGMSCVKEMGGINIVQSPEDAQVTEMPQCAINKELANKVLASRKMANEINQLMN